MSTRKKDYYAILGVAQTARPDELRRAFYKAAKNCHPDLHPGDKKQEDQFKDLAEAYEVLSDQNKRALYDRTGRVDDAGGEADWENFDWGGFFELEEEMNDFFSRIPIIEDDAIKKVGFFLLCSIIGAGIGFTLGPEAVSVASKVDRVGAGLLGYTAGSVFSVISIED